MKLIIKAEKIKDRIHEQKLAIRRGWKISCSGFDGKDYFIELYKNRKKSLGGRKRR